MRETVAGSIRSVKRWNSPAQIEAGADARA
jgi:hypothetical protein